MNDEVPEVQCPGCGTTIRARLGDQVVIAELRAQGWRPPTTRKGTEVQFNRVDLIKAAQDTIDAESARLQREAAEKNAELEQQHAEWTAAYGEAWSACLTRLRKKLRNGQVIYTEDLPRSPRYGGVAVFGPRAQAYHSARTFESPDLNNLIAVLSTITDETVTPSGLRAVGITPGALSAALRTLGRTAKGGN